MRLLWIPDPSGHLKEGLGNNLLECQFLNPANSANFVLDFQCDCSGTSFQNFYVLPYNYSLPVFKCWLADVVFFPSSQRISLYMQVIQAVVVLNHCQA